VHPNNRLPTILLAVGAGVLILAVAIGERMGDRVIGQATDRTLQSATGAVTPEPDATAGPYGPDWKRSQALTAANDPRFPDPRVPPQPLPTPLVTPTPAPTVPPTPTPNPNIPIWRQQPLPTATPSAEAPSGEQSPVEQPSASSPPDAARPALI
jgi:DNA polymerase-3 subunit gamma/tau